MHSYAAFGTHLNSAIELPELAPARERAGRPWTLGVQTATPPQTPTTPLGSDSVYGSVGVRLSRAGVVFRLEFDDTGTFDIDVVERSITWHPGPRRDGDAVRADILGRVMAVAAHAEGALVLHASAVAIDGVGVALLGPKRAGKSTLAMALVTAGARLLTDDTLVVRFAADGNAVASPGVQRVRLWPDSLHALGSARAATLGAKPTLDALTAHQVEGSDTPLAACYVLHPVDGLAGVPVRREALSAKRGSLACVSFAKLGALLGGSESEVVLDRAVRLTRSTTFHLASIQRDLGRIDMVAREVMAWHRTSTTTRDA